MKVLFTYDFLTTHTGLGRTMVSKFAFLKSLFTHINVDLVLDTKQLGKAIDYQMIYPDKTLWPPKQYFHFFNVDELSSVAMEEIQDYVSGYDVVIAYELSPATIEVFDRLGVQYVDIWMAPQRFCSDIMFAARANFRESVLAKFVESEDRLIESADKIRAQCNLLPPLNIDLESNSALLIGQLLQDKSVWDGEKFLTLADYLPRLKQIAANYNVLYLLKHPMMDEQVFDKVFAELSSIKNLQYLQNVNAYQLLNQPQIEKVVAISSSVLAEAVYFQKRTEYLFQPVIKPSYQLLYEALFNSQFWGELLGLQVSKVNTAGITLLHYDNYLRLLFGAVYAYDVFLGDTYRDPEMVRRDAAYDGMVKLFRFVEQVDSSEQYVLFGFGSVAKLIYPHIRQCVKGVIDNNLKKEDLPPGLDLLTIDSLNADDNLIITAFKYSDEIVKQLKHCPARVIRMSI